jgi:hypothetical protein
VGATIVRGLLLLFLIAAIMSGYAIHSGRVKVPPKWNPFAPLDVREPPGPLTAIKLWRTTRDPATCAAALETSGLTYRPVADSSAPAGCELKDAVRVTHSDAGYGGPFIASCPLAIGMALFERQYLRPAAGEFFGQGVKRIDHVGSYACRNVNNSPNNRQDGRLSQHASANAIDLTGFVLEDGRRITLARWDEGSADAAFLRRVHEGACRVFNTTLGPDYNALHRTHFHVDMGPYRICR